MIGAAGLFDVCGVRQDMDRANASSTSLSLLHHAKAHDDQAWRRLVDLYGPVIYRWCRRSGLAAADAQDVAQEVFSAVFVSLADFRHTRPGDSFRGWLWTIARSKIDDHFRRRRGRAQARGGTTAHQHLEQLPALPQTPPGPLSETDELLSRRVYDLVRPQFEPLTWQAFWRLTVDQQTGPDVAAELGLSVQAVYQAKSRVLRRIREEFGEILQ
jgi:RNA polymerase sigma-70 factor (ECF subfamily)